MKLGIDIGSTTVKLVVLDEDNTIKYSRYERHMSNIFEKVMKMMEDLHEQLGDVSFYTTVTGSGGLSLSKLMGVYFEQEVISCSKAVEELIPQTDVAIIELGGERCQDHFLRATT